MVRRRMSGGSGTQTALMVGGGLLLVYLFTRPKTTPNYPGAYSTPGSNLPASTASTTNTAITAGASILNNIINQIWG